ncbi:carbohydrate ABC transporter permease [Paenibacillus elgii]|uniref:carbohydrate ABC transporter permease n=1 Tax=Paenibacillus elgii TaxID=189691 RepID=UPI0030DAD95E
MNKRLIDYSAGYLFILPYVTGALVFFLLPALMSFYYLFTRYKVISPPQFIGLDNFRQILHDTIFWEAFKNTFYFVALYVPGQVILPLIFAVLLYNSVSLVKGKFATALRAVYYFPAIPSWFIIGTVWLWLLNSDAGIINQLLSATGLSKIPFLQTDSPSLIPSLAAVAVWKGLGYGMFIYYIGLRNISETLYEVAKIDGASWWHRHKTITVPLLSPTIFLILIMAISDGFKSFDQHYTMVFNRSANNKTHLMVYLYEKAFRYLDMGYASLIAWVVFVCLILITLVVLKLQKRWVHYEH